MSENYPHQPDTDELPLDDGQHKRPDNPAEADEHTAHAEPLHLIKPPLQPEPTPNTNNGSTNQTPSAETLPQSSANQQPAEQVSTSFADLLVFKEDANLPPILQETVRAMIEQHSTSPTNEQPPISEESIRILKEILEGSKDPDATPAKENPEQRL